ncbi:hypothetical protein [Tautonia plasticadhaerens]|uniref:Uncharacterized protein n=1 Tax=Tautonia plasticadhaerens TaxID=2527974 RepID=A0A518HA58_9BACT|nr:hypothetical protein [Tautonia plasticadhaerens]QDV37719.1 hypothetical protein ElP_56620 [Tautonia plasticadhaerens]
MSSTRTAPTIEQFSAYNEAFDYFNKRLFDGRLGPAMLSIARKGRSKGYFTPRKWRNKAGEQVHEIAISPDLIAEGLDATMAQVVALMGRQLRWQEAIEAGDEKAASTAARGYADARQCEIWLELGLLPMGKDGGRTRGGWNLDVEVVLECEADMAIEAVPKKAMLPWEAVAGGQPEGDDEPRRKTGRLKYTCPICEAHVLGRPGLEVRCKGYPDDHPPERMRAEDEPPVEEDVEIVEDKLSVEAGDEDDEPTDTRVKELVKEPAQKSRSEPEGPQPQPAQPEPKVLEVEWKKGDEKGHGPGWHVPAVGGEEVEGLAIRRAGTDRWRLFGPKVVETTGEDDLDFETFRSGQIVAERLLRGEPHGTLEFAHRQGRRDPDPHSPAAAPHLSRLGEWADAVKRDEALTWNDLAKLEARWGAAQRSIYSSRRRWVGKEMEMRVGEAKYQVYDPKIRGHRSIQVPEGTRVRVTRVTATTWNDDEIDCMIVGGKNDGLEIRFKALNLREVPPQGVPARDDDAEAEESGEPSPPPMDSVLLGYHKGEIHLARVEGKETEAACGEGKATDWDYGTFSDLTCEECQSLYARQARGPFMASIPPGKVILLRGRGSGKHVHVGDRRLGEPRCGAGILHMEQHVGDPAEVTCKRCRAMLDREAPAQAVEGNQPQVARYALYLLDGRSYHLRNRHHGYDAICGTKSRHSGEHAEGPLSLVTCKRCLGSQYVNLCKLD